MFQKSDTRTTGKVLFQKREGLQVWCERKTTKQPIKNYKKLSQKKPDAQRSDCTPRAKITKGTTARSLKGCQRWDNRNHTKIAKSTMAESTRKCQRRHSGQSAQTWRKCSDGHMSIGDPVCDFVQTDRAKALRLSRRAFVIQLHYFAFFDTCNFTITENVRRQV